MNDNQLILKEIRAFFKSKKISQKEVAERIGKKQSYINCILTGKIKITRDTAQLLHDAYNFSKEYLLFGTGELFENSAPCEQIDEEQPVAPASASNDALISRLIDELVEERRINQELQAKIQQLQDSK